MWPAWWPPTCIRIPFPIANRDHYDPQDLACAAGGLILCKEDLAKKVDSAVFPGIQGGPLMHVIAAKAVAFGEALRPELWR